MNLQILNQSLARNTYEINPIVNAIFDKVIARIDKNGRSVNVKTFINTLNTALKGTRVRVTRELTKRFGSAHENGWSAGTASFSSTTKR